MDGVRVDREKAFQVIGLLIEGMGIRAIQRFTGLHQETVLNILASAGEQCARLLNYRVRNIRSDFVQADELYSFVKTKEQNTADDDMEHGNFFTHLSICRDSKLIINYQVSKRSWQDSENFMRDLQSRMSGKFTLCTDGLPAYIGRAGAVRKVFGDTINYASEIKQFYTKPSNMYSFRVARRIGSGEFIAVKRKARIGNPDLRMTTTCHVERTNLSVRLFNRRFTRLTLGYSKTLDNLRHSVALFVAHFNFCRVHSTLKQTPAMAAGLTNSVWSIKELLKMDYSTM
jgi:IS1 family transposase